jgi:hypothetical protein
LSVTVQPVFIGKVPNWHNEAYLLAPAAVLEDSPIQPLLLALIGLSPLFSAAMIFALLR